MYVSDFPASVVKSVDTHNILYGNNIDKTYGQPCSSGLGDKYNRTIE